MLYLGHNKLVNKINSMVLLLTHSIRLNSVKNMIDSGRNKELYEAHERVYNLVASRQSKGLYRSIKGTYFVEEDQLN